jgi:hypothetical protein
MQIEKITSENPEIHWRFLNCENKIVMDMGCSFWDSTWHDDWLSSSEYFVSKGASKLIGFDCAAHDIEKYHQLYGNAGKYYTFQLCVNANEQIEDLLEHYKPQVIKCDIEGAEIHFQNVTKEMIEFVDEIAIEYHNDPTRILCEQKMVEWGFTNHQLYQLGNEDINRVGVWHLWR